MDFDLPSLQNPGTEESVDNQNNLGFLPTATVIVPIYNGEADLPDLIKCLQAQTYPSEQVKYLLVDNASRDRTAEIIQAAAEATQAQGLNLRYLSETDIQSSYAARNTGIRAATGEILAFTDADCRPHSNWLRQLVQPFADPEVGLVAGAIAAFPGSSLLEQYAARKKVLSQETSLSHPFGPFGKTANLAIRFQVFKQVGLFRSYLTTGGDADFCWRTQQDSSWHLRFAPQAIVEHCHRTTFRELNKQWLRYGQSHRYLHELHAIGLAPELKSYQYTYRLVRWLVKELPFAALQAITGQRPWVDLAVPPIHLLTLRTQAIGQRTAQLPDIARQIDWL